MQASGATSAMARAVFDEWRLAHAMRDFAAWLECGAPSDDSAETASKPIAGSRRALPDS
jgi:hypothetical protein